MKENVSARLQLMTTLRMARVTESREDSQMGWMKLDDMVASG